MSVSFMIGRAGSGKTRRCLDAIVESLRKQPIGPPIFWLLPRQATFSMERELTCNSGLGGFLRARVLSFEQLGHEILRERGGRDHQYRTNGEKAEHGDPLCRPALPRRAVVQFCL